MKVELFPFQNKAVRQLRVAAAEGLGGYRRTGCPQVVSFTAPTGAGKTIILAALLEDIYYGTEDFAEQPEAIFVWLSDSPELNEQSKLKIDLRADKIRLSQCVTVSDDSFDRETFEDGHIYFLNTQKLGKGSNLTKHSDSRQYTIWETLENTLREKSDRLYVVIDEAHRGMRGREAGKATTIMQKFIMGSVADRLAPMPLIIGMSATTERFNALVGNTSSTVHKVVVSPDEVRASGLLKDRIIISYPEESLVNKDMAVLQAAADDWKDKWDHWTQYCQEQHYAYVNPVFIIQVLNGTGKEISDTDLSDCLRKIEERTGFRFSDGEVVHTFGQTTSALPLNGISVRYEEPSRIADDRNIKVVFFKENLSTGWDCPRAETMMSFRRATDATYIAQLLGRMVRTPMQMRIQVDDSLNDVHLFLPHFDKANVKSVVDELQSAEGGSLPTDIEDEQIGDEKRDILTIRPKKKRPGNRDVPGQENWLKNDTDDTNYQETQHPSASGKQAPAGEVKPGGQTAPIVNAANNANTLPSADKTPESSKNKDEHTPADAGGKDQDAANIVPAADESPFDREEIMRAVNDMGLLTYHVRRTTVNNYYTSMFKMARLLSQSGLYETARVDIVAEIVDMIRETIEGLKAAGRYEELVKEAQAFKLSTQIFDVFGESVDAHAEHELFSSTDTDIDRQFRMAEIKLGREGIGIAYGKEFYDPDEPNLYKIDVILFVADEDCLAKLNRFAETRFHRLNDDYRRYMITTEERYRNQYDSIVSDGDIVSKHNFRLPETISVPHEDGGKNYADHLFVNDDGVAHIRLNTWESGVLAEEQKRPDFVCWLRNPSRKPWALCIPYLMGTEYKSAYPDFLVVRKDAKLGYIVDILEPHNPDFDDNLAKAQGFAEYARQNQTIGRIQLIRKGKDPAGHDRFRRLDMSRSAVREKVMHATTSSELDHIFETDGVI